MTKNLFPRIATVEFRINGTDQTVTVSNLPYTWNPAVDGEIEGRAVFLAIAFLRSTGMTQGLDHISTSTSPA